MINTSRNMQSTSAITSTPRGTIIYLAKTQKIVWGVSWFLTATLLPCARLQDRLCAQTASECANIQVDFRVDIYFTLLSIGLKISSVHYPSLTLIIIYALLLLRHKNAYDGEKQLTYKTKHIMYRGGMA